MVSEDRREDIAQPAPPADRRPPAAGTMSRGGFLRRLGLAAGTIAVVGAGALGYRAYDQGVLAVGDGPAYDAWSSWDDGKGLLSLVGAATLAPSPHNAQAWLFDVSSDRIDVFADIARNTGAIDPFRREMYVGLGAALENLVLAARAAGYAPNVELMPADREPTHAARVLLARESARSSDLYAQIPQRRSNRHPYVTEKAVPAQALASMAALAGADTPDTRLIWFTEPAARGRVSELLVAATESIIGDPDQSASDFAWFRQDWDELQRRRDGITVDAAGLSDLTAALAKLLPAQSESFDRRVVVDGHARPAHGDRGGLRDRRRPRCGRQHAAVAWRAVARAHPSLGDRRGSRVASHEPADRAGRPRGAARARAAVRGCARRPDAVGLAGTCDLPDGIPDRDAQHEPTQARRLGDHAMSATGAEPRTRTRPEALTRLAARLGVVGGALGLIAGFVALTVGERSAPGSATRTTRPGWV